VGGFVREVIFPSNADVRAGAPVPTSRLQLPQRSEAFAAGRKLRGLPFLDDKPFVENDDAVSFEGRREPVRDRQHATARREHQRRAVPS